MNRMKFKQFLTMKKTILLLIYPLLLVGCKSATEKATENYLMETDFNETVTAAALLNAEIIKYEIRNFNNNPIDTAYKWEEFKEKKECKEILYSYNIDKLNRMYKANADFADFFKMYSEDEINEQIEKVKKDSIEGAEIEQQIAAFKESNEIAYYVYEFDLYIKTKLAGKNIEKTNKKIAFITPSDEVIKIEDSKKE